ncbi:adenylyltransferase/cytidyltransferase family protein [Virgibacillus dakarensis]|uniref:adenylyltransferase/cytidyltransferase family protein n=1 Tax=Virgibacillus dakarensis TaxID=1917889 RepID=UPI00190E68AD|nr:adenylyltransferase/cytidyltransferase family protein [Virgibacillus dakarensis]
MKKAITYGTFDILHTGHINLLGRAKKYGDYLAFSIIYPYCNLSLNFRLSSLSKW